MLIVQRAGIRSLWLRSGNSFSCPLANPLTPEQQAREDIGRQLAAAGWVVQDKDAVNLSASSGVAVRKLQSQGGPADYLLLLAISSTTE